MRLISKVQTMKIGTDASNFHDCQKCTPCAGDAPTRRLTRAPRVDTVGPFRRPPPAGGGQTRTRTVSHPSPSRFSGAAKKRTDS